MMEGSNIILDEPGENLEEVYPSHKGVDKFMEVNPALADTSIFQRSKDIKVAHKLPLAVPLPGLDTKNSDSKKDKSPHTPTPTSSVNGSPLNVTKEGPVWKKVRKRASAGILNHWSQRWFQLIPSRKTLRYHLSETADYDHASRGEYALADCYVQCFLGGKGREFGFMITCPKDLAPRAILACSTARDLQEWLHALASIMPIETQGVPVPLLRDGSRHHTRHATAPTKIEFLDDDMSEHRESESRRRDSDNMKKQRRYLRRVVSSSHALSDKDEIQEMSRKARLTASQFDRTRIEVCISRLSFLEESGALEMDQLRILFEEISLKSGEVIAALMSQTDEEIAELGNDLLVEKSRHAALDGKVRSLDTKERWSTAVRKARRLLHRPNAISQTEHNRLSDRIPQNAINDIQSRANLMSELHNVTSERSLEDYSSDVLRITISSDSQDAYGNKTDQEVLDKHLRQRSGTDDSAILASLRSAVRSSKRISRDLLFGKRDSPRQGDDHVSSPKSASGVRTSSNASTTHSLESSQAEPRAEQVTEPNVANVTKKAANKGGLDPPPEQRTLPRMMSSSHFKPISLLNSMRRVQSSSKFPTISMTQTQTTTTSNTKPSEKEKSADVVQRHENSDVARTDTEESAEDIKWADITACKSKQSESERFSSPRPSSHRRNSSVDVEAFDAATDDVDTVLSAQTDIGLIRNPYSSDGGYASHPPSPQSSTPASPSKLTVNALSLLQCDSNDFTENAKDLISLRGPDIFLTDSNDAMELLPTVDSSRSNRSVQTITSDGGSTLRSSLKTDNRNGAGEAMSKLPKRVQFNDTTLRFYNYTIGESVPSDGGPPIGLGWNWSESEVLVFSVGDFEQFRGGDYDPLVADVDEEWDDNWRIPREYFAEDGNIPTENRLQLLRANGHRRPSIDLSTLTTSHLAISRRRNSRSKAAKLLISGADPDEVHAWQTEVDNVYKVRYYAVKWLQRTFPNRTFALMLG